MDNTENQKHDPEDMLATRQSLAATIDRLTAKTPLVTSEALGLTLTRWEAPTELTAYMHEPSLCLVAQGAKRLLLGEELFSYDADHYLIASVELPLVAQIIEASPEKPYFGLKLVLDLRMISQLLVDSNLPMPRTQKTNLGIAVSRVDLRLLESFQRLLDLFDTPEDIPILAPLLQKEIVYRLLTGEQGLLLRQMGTVGSQPNQIGQVITWLKQNYTKALRVDDLAAHARMSAATFHRHFRELTSMSPLQFQKRIRLHEARRMMFTDHMDASSAALQVGYESSTQFNREYSRLFGAPPLRNVKALRKHTTDMGKRGATAEGITSKDV
jgi:AraC-like DNA-binding protein